MAAARAGDQHPAAVGFQSRVSGKTTAVERQQDRNNTTPALPVPIPHTPDPGGFGLCRRLPREHGPAPVLGMGPQDTSPPCEGQEKRNRSGDAGPQERTTGWRPSPLLPSFLSFSFSSSPSVSCTPSPRAKGRKPQRFAVGPSVSPAGQPARAGAVPWLCQPRAEVWTPTVGTWLVSRQKGQHKSRRGGATRAPEDGGAGIPGGGHGHMDLPKGQSCSERGLIRDPHPIKVLRK